MDAFKAFLNQFCSDGSGAVALEYAMICLLIFLVIVASFDIVATSTVFMYDDLVAAMKSGD